MSVLTTTDGTSRLRAWLRRRPARRVKPPVIFQMEALECGAASLAMILAHYKRYVPLEELRVACGVSRDGSKASNVLKAARRYGLTATGRRMDTEALSKLAPPAILFWEFNHFVVLNGFGRRLGKDVVHLNDPGSGPRVVNLADFDESFTGVVLTMSPGEEFRPGGRRPGVLASMPTRLRGSWGLLALSAYASVLLAVVGVAYPALTRAFVNSILLGGDRSFLMAFFGLMAATVMATGVLTFLRQAFLLRLRISNATINSSRFLRHVFRLPINFFVQRSPADISSRVQSNDQVAVTLSNDLSSTLVNALVVVLYACLLWAYDPWLTVLSVSLSLLNIVALRAVARIRAGGVSRLATDEAQLLNTSYSGLQLIETMKATGGENTFFRRWAKEQSVVVTGQQRIGVPSAVMAVVAPTLASVTTSLLLLIGGLEAVKGDLTVGLLVAFQALVSAFVSPIAQLIAVAQRVQDFAVQVTRLRDVENYQPEPRPAASDAPAGRLAGNLTFDRVTFGYNPLDAPLVSEFSFAVGPGRQVALVGGSGSGKSTAVRLISGLYRPWEGSVDIDGLPRDGIAPEVLSASVGFVDQDVFLFEGTVRDNITLWDTSISDDQVIAALRDAAVYDVVSSRPGGIYAQVEEDGRNFSGGQRQRLEIARALVRNPRLLVLDEATSALDAETELLIMNNIRRHGCATVVVAHRLSTIRDSDEIVVLSRGDVVERGTHDALSAAGGAYAQLIREH
ncbi:NHLP family bacteriocin export ABC transporter peptidase/permease/ATPase subunit [Streptomyces sp. CB01881]|uniref:NHLP family bacteriocin export ABC transporter peptidase/permease/ATPase subunit n=1 Tax=Streptomyces sp. CB01881 TaxID=2078691 RepID=UPI000CDC4978|nr:NHLP family bacteriocin export ABC transporter peptidase/permease/ATPase subunit [Streptomyces sp. CB01881]AUY53069.1 NHLP family bacteriocin export ABC transporter peptidase/permease/ATPase subunit [Streptomyces sp. CB01881]TYC70785.1 NHLP family bacteriocin export ABC transporter peptidase/permease/ATPase subunit [Streptomyces sp. CB01881]